MDNKNLNCCYGKAKILLAFIILLLALFIVNSLFFINSKNASIQASSLNIISEVEGSVLSIIEDESTEIKKGQILAQIDKTKYEKEIDEIQKKLNKAKENLKISDENITKETLEKEQLKNRIKETTKQLEYAKSDYIHYANAYKDGAVTKKDLDNASKNLDIAQSNFKKAHTDYSLVISSIKSKIPEKMKQSNKIESLEEQLETSELNLSDTTIISPIDGTIIKRSVKTGEVVKKGSPILTLASKDFFISANFTPSQISKLKVNQKVKIKISSCPFKKINGKISEINKDDYSAKIDFVGDISKLTLSLNDKVKIKIY